MSERLAAAIRKEAERIGADPQDFATVISFETGGTFDPNKRGPVTKWGRHVGLIQMGEPQRKKYGYYEGMPIEDAVRASADYLVDNGFKPGMGLMQMYATINAGSPDKVNASDTAAGGTWGTVADKVNHQMEGHKSKAAALLGGTYVPQKFDGFTDADGKENAGIDYETAYEAPKAVSPPTYLEEASQQPAPYSSWFEELGASFKSNSMTSHVYRVWSEGAIDWDFQIGQERAAELSKQVPDHYLDFILTSGSEETLRSRLQWMSEDMERQQKLAAGGLSATAAGFVAGVIDPIPLVAGVATGGYGAAALKFGRAGRVAAGAAIGAGENAALEIVSKEGLDNPNADPAMGAVFGAAFGALGGALSRGPGGTANPDAQKAFRLAGDANAGKVREHPDPVLVAGTDSINAARNTTSLSPLIPRERAYDTEVHDADAPVGYGGKLRIDVTGQMTTSDLPLVRTLGAHLGEETAGFKDHSVVPDSANARATAYNRKFIGNFISVHKAAEEQYIKEVAGIRSGLFHPLKAARARQDFNRQVFDWVMDRNPSPDTHPSIVKSGTAFRKGMSDWRDEMERSGLATLDRDPHYVPLVTDAGRVADLDVRIDEPTMHEFFSEAIKRHSPSLSPDVVKRMSEGYWRNIRKAGWGMENDIERAMAAGDREAFKEALLAGLEGNKKLSDAEVDEAFEAVTRALDGTGKDPNAAASRGMKVLKRRTLMDYTFKARVRGRNGEEIDLRVTDLFEQDAELLFRRYSRSMSGRVALAETRIENPSKPGHWITEGIKSEADIAKLKDAIREEARQMRKSDEVENQIKNLDFMYKRIAGIPVWDQSGALAKWARRIKQVQFIRLMNNMGLNQIQEGWKIMVLTGFRASYDQMPSIRQMVMGIKKGKFQANALNEELQAMTGVGVDGLFSTRALKAMDERIGETAGGRIGRKIDGALDYMSEITSSISLMRSIHDTQSNWSAAAITQQMANIARRIRTDTGFDFSKLRQGDKDRLASIGLGEKDAALILRNLHDNATFNGKKLVRVNHQAWDPEAISKYRVFVGRYVDRLVQANDFGGLSKWMSHPIASMLVQFRSFVLGAWPKSTLWALNHGTFTDPTMMVLLAGEIVMGSATHAIRAAALLTEVDGWEQYKEKVLNPKGLLANGFARTASASIVPMLVDSAITWLKLGEPLFGSARSSGSATDAFFGSPAVDQLDSAGAFLGGLADAAFTDKPFTQKTAKHGLRAFAPFGNWIPIAAGFSALTRGLPER
ncbi:hypothetical protein LO749_20815 [Paracoccus denitrificans]|uniref:hypothetical protein n=1 Tax=Paracoccus denitrificans TaxID=266 RepID=UPI001E59B850|nr:hypothetical protein [Paracoccus denitrificans]UFS66937.1 hypothetical protein LO749_20815 [Paracoccus denitrificans]